MLQIIKDLQKMLADFIKNQNIKDEYTNADICGCRATDQNQQEEINTNTNDISDNRQGLTETFEATLNNTDDVAINRQAIEELYEMLTTESEVK